MRPIRLKMSAFGAYVNPIELDFEKGLGGENFFLIHGATGSGKTTILDAICYALYGEDFGGKNGRKGSIMRSEHANPTAKTEVEFTFGLRGKIYRIVRNPKYERAKLRGGGVTEEKASAEIYENGCFVSTKNVTEYVKELLQFDCEQFRQVVVLPQGEFKKFLTARSDEKQKVLNMLFNAEFFKRVEEELKLKSSEARKIFETLTERKKNYLEEIGTEEELPTLIETLSEELDAAQIRLKALTLAAETAQRNYIDGEKISEQFKELQIRTAELANTQKVLEKTLGELKAAQIEFDKRKSEESLCEDLKISVSELSKKKISLQNLQNEQVKLEQALTEAEKSANEVARLIKRKKSCDDTMAQLKAEVERLSDAPAKLKVAEQKLTDAKNRAKLISEVENLRGEIVLAAKNLSIAEKNYADAEKSLEELREAQKSGRAAILAATLSEGDPCPVCGSIHHPKLATSESVIPTDAQIKAAESRLKSLADKKSSAEKILARLKGELETKEKNLSDNAEVITVSTAQAEVDRLLSDKKKLDEYNARIKKGDVKIRETDENLSAARAADKKFAGVVENLRGIVDNMTQEVDAKYLSDKKLLDEEISSATRELNQLNAAFERAQDNFNRLSRLAAAQRATVDAAEKNKSDASAQVEGKILPDMVALKKARDDAKIAEKLAIETNTQLSERLKRIKSVSDKIFALSDKLKLADEEFLMWKTLSDAASGKTSRISFQRYYLATMFKEVIAEANNRLEKMSNGRYLFKNKAEVTDKRYSGGLDLEIVDDYTGTTRPVETLSGGESFLASLSLALGLAAVVQNNSGGIKLDTIFIDEGFGTLDAETLDFAMKTLIELQSGGRLVGIISHVEELKNQIPVRLEVTKTKTGSTAKFIS